MKIDPQLHKIKLLHQTKYLQLGCQWEIAIYGGDGMGAMRTNESMKLMNYRERGVNAQGKVFVGGKYLYKKLY